MGLLETHLFLRTRYTRFPQPWFLICQHSRFRSVVLYVGLFVDLYVELVFELRPAIQIEMQHHEFLTCHKSRVWEARLVVVDAVVICAIVAGRAITKQISTTQHGHLFTRN